MTVWKPGAFAGETTSREIAGALMSEVRHTRPLSVAAHSHAAPYFSLLLEGSYSESAADFTVRYEPYTLVFHDALTEHSDVIAAPGCRMFFVELLGPWTELIARIAKPAHLFELHGGSPAWLILRLHREFVAAEAAQTLVIESVLFELCEYLSLSTIDTSVEPDWLARVEDVLYARLSLPVDLHAIAGQVGVHPSHLCRTFRRFHHRTIGDFVIGLRLQQVCRKLTETDEPLSDIAAQAGFADQSHMTRIFKRMTGATPASYRKQQI